MTCCHRRLVTGVIALTVYSVPIGAQQREVDGANAVLPWAFVLNDPTSGDEEVSDPNEVVTVPDSRVSMPRSAINLNNGPPDWHPDGHPPMPELVATGGGAVLREENRRALRDRGTVVYLMTTVEQQLKRTAKDRNRPLLQCANREQVLNDMFAARDPLYRATSDITVRTSAKSTLIKPGRVMSSAIPCTAPRNTSFAALKACNKGVPLPITLSNFSFGIVISRLFQLSDPRTVGSRNTGATNVLRSGNKFAAILTLLGDVLKGTLVVGIAIQMNLAQYEVACVSLSVLIGHIFPIYYKFKGCS